MQVFQQPRRAAAEDPPGAGFVRLAEALPTESEGLVHCFFYHAKRGEYHL
ncbi:hypothetical protein ACE4RR_21130 [Alteribacillus sp. HJP-4]